MFIKSKRADKTNYVEFLSLIKIQHKNYDKLKFKFINKEQTITLKMPTIITISDGQINIQMIPHEDSLVCFLWSK